MLDKLKLPVGDEEPGVIHPEIQSAFELALAELEKLLLLSLGEIAVAPVGCIQL